MLFFMYSIFIVDVECFGVRDIDWGVEGGVYVV